MKHLFLLLSLLSCVTLMVGQEQQLKIAFITSNAYGNNLYLDNVTLGRQYANDVAVVAITNFASDTTYAIGSGPAVTAPAVTIVNPGTNAIASSFTVTFTASPGGYTSSKTIPSLARGAVAQVVMDSLTIPLSTPMTFTVIAEMPADENRSNDTLQQSALFLPGARRMVLLEEWTSSTCGPCASNNPTIDAFIAARFDSVVAVKYHVGWPGAGDDPMYLYNPTQSYDRRYYYGVNSVPHVIMDGVVDPAYPYSTPASLPDAFAVRRPVVGTPVSVTVHDSTLAGDSIQATVTVTIHSPLPGGSYRLRVHAVEHLIQYPSPPGTNGEQDFLDVFRGAYPNSNGTSIPTTVGNYSFVFRYKLSAPVVMGSVYTIAFVQNDLTKEVFNSGKSLSAHRVSPSRAVSAPSEGDREMCFSGEPAPTRAAARDVLLETLGTGFTYEMFELAFPPAGWRLVNPDNGITLQRYAGANGPTLGGSVSTRIDFYSYSGSGQTDTLYTSPVAGLFPTDSLKFDWAYAQYPGYSDRLIVKVSTNGGVTFDSTIFDQSGAALATAPATTSSFVPSSTQWKTFRYPLTGLVRPAPLAPVLAGPDNGATGVPLTPRLTWHPSIGTQRYRLQVSPDSGFTIPAFDDSTLTDTSRVLPALPAGSLFFWRVRGKNTGGSSPWSEIHRFTTMVLMTNRYPVQNAWNLVALPLTVADPRKVSLFPSAVSEAYTFSVTSGYVRRDTILNGIGYWLKFPGPDSVVLTGYERLSDSVGVTAGWNLVGSITAPVLVSSIRQTPPGVLTSPFYRYSSGYASVDTLWPAQGYWVKASGSGSVLINVPVAKPTAKPGGRIRRVQESR